MESVPEALPALIRARKVQKKAADVGFDFPVTADAFKKVYEELEKTLEIQLMELQTKKPNKYKELVEWEKIVNSQKNNVRC